MKHTRRSFIQSILALPVALGVPCVLKGIPSAQKEIKEPNTAPKEEYITCRATTAFPVDKMWVRIARPGGISRAIPVKSGERFRIYQDEHIAGVTVDTTQSPDIRISIEKA